METIEVKTAELEGAALDWAVLAALEVNGNQSYWKSQMLERPQSYTFRPSADWSQGGPLIERHRIRFCDLEGQWRAMVGYEDSEIGESHYFDVYAEDFEGAGDTHLIAACRAIVAVKLGDTVQVPVELIGATS